MKRPRRRPAERPQLFAPPPAPPAARPRARAGDEPLVLTSDEDLVRWNRRRIAEVLVRETGLDARTAEAISQRVEAQVTRAGLEAVSTAALRELVGAELLALGLADARTRHARLGPSLYDVGRCIRGREVDQAPPSTSPEPAGDPEQSALALGRRLKRDYALAAVLSGPVGDAHRRGALHVHDLDAIDRPTALWLGLAGLEQAALVKGGADRRDPDLAVERLAGLVGVLARHLAGTIGLDALDLALAPAVAGLSAAALERTARRLLDRLATAAGAGRGRVEISLHLDPPAELAATPVAGLGGAHGDHLEAARRLARALIDARGEGAGAGVALVLVVGPSFFQTPGHLALLEAAVRAASRTGTPTFRLLRAGEPLHGSGPVVTPRRRAALPRLAPPPAGDGALAAAAVLATVSVNLPRVGYQAGPDEEAIEVRLRATLELAARAHLEQRVFLEELLARGEDGPLAFLRTGGGGAPLLILDQARHPILLSGLNELAELVVGLPLHAGDKAVEFAERLLERAGRHVERLTRRHRLGFVLGGAPLLAPAERFAKLDLRYHSPAAGHRVKGDLARGRVRYAPGIAFDPDAALTPLARARGEGRLQPLASWGSRTGLAATGSPRAIAALVMQAYLRSTCREIVLG